MNVNAAIWRWFLTQIMAHWGRAKEVWVAPVESLPMIFPIYLRTNLWSISSRLFVISMSNYGPQFNPCSSFRRPPVWRLGWVGGSKMVPIEISFPHSYSTYFYTHHRHFRRNTLRGRRQTARVAESRLCSNQVHNLRKIGPAFDRSRVWTGWTSGCQSGIPQIFRCLMWWQVLKKRSLKSIT